MNQDEKAKIAETLAVMAEITGKTFSQTAIVHMVQAMDDLEFDAVMRTLSVWGRTEKIFPHPADIREKVKPEVTSKDDAQDVANLVIAAVSKFGYTNPQLAEEYMGSLGWETVRRMGGWRHLCETLDFKNEGVMRAQIRDYAETVRRKAIGGKLEKPPELPSLANSYVQTIVGNSMKGIDQK